MPRRDLQQKAVERYAPVIRDILAVWPNELHVDLTHDTRSANTYVERLRDAIRGQCDFLYPIEGIDNDKLRAIRRDIHISSEDEKTVSVRPKSQKSEETTKAQAVWLDLSNPPPDVVTAVAVLCHHGLAGGLVILRGVQESSVQELKQTYDISYQKTIDRIELL